MALVTVAEATGHLRMELETDGGSPPEIVDNRYPDLLLKIEMASAIVVNYLKYEETWWSPETVPVDIKASVLLVLESLFDDSAKGEMIAGLSGGNLQNAVVALLHRHRDPALA